MNLQTTRETTPDLTTQLWRIVRGVNRSDIKTVHALISKMTGSQAAAVMALKLLYWFPRARKADGWVYKSWRDWKAECNLSQSQIKRVHSAAHLERIGIERKIMKANGSPTMHYRIDVEFLLRCVSDFLDAPVAQVQARIQPVPNPDPAPIDAPDSNQTIRRKQPDPNGRIDQPQVAETTKTITSIYQQDLPPQQEQTTQQQPVVVYQAESEADRFNLQHELEAIGICRTKAEFLLGRHAPERVREVLDHARFSPVSNPPGFVISALERFWHFGPADTEHLGVTPADPMRYVTGEYAAFVNH